MQTVEKNQPVVLSYCIRSWGGELIEEAPYNAPISYVHGYGQILGRLESALEGKAPGDSVSVRLRAAQAYGEWSEEFVRAVPKRDLAHLEGLAVGDEIEIRNGRWELVDDSVPAPDPLFSEGEPFSDDDEDEGADEPSIYEVREIFEETVLLDGNHYLAGQDLIFDLHVLDVKPATFEEIERCRWDCGPEDDLY